MERSTLFLSSVNHLFLWAISHMLNNQRVYKLSKKRTEDAIDKKDLTLGCAAPLTGKKACIRLVSQPQLMVGFEVLTPWLVDLHVQWPLWGNKRPFPETSKHNTLLAGLYIYTFIIYIYTCFHPAYESRSCRAYSWTTSKGLIVRTDAVVLCSGSYLC